MWLLVFFTLLFTTFIGFGQRQIHVLDSSSVKPMPFVKVITENGENLFTDIDGKVVIKEDENSARFRFQGYKDTTLDLSQLNIDTLFMRPSFQVIQEVVAKAGENPAHRIMDQVIKNRKKNHPLENDAFTYDSYSKFLFDIDDASKRFLTDSFPSDSIRESLQFLNEQHVFIVESATKRKFMPPVSDKEEIVAYKVSGFSHPSFSTFAQSMQSFHCYDNQIALLEEEYINPIALGGTKRYLFILEDTTVIAQDTTFTISFRPRKGKNFKGLQGQLYINTKGYAVEKIVAEPYGDSSEIKVKIVQDYKWTDDAKWFPNQLSLEVRMLGIFQNSGIEDGYILGTGHSYLTNVRINPEGLKRRGFDNIAIQTEEGAENTSDEEWEQLRLDDLTDKEQQTYVVIDSLVKDSKLDRQFNNLMMLSTGRIPIKKVDLLLAKLLDFNFYEGYRLGAGLETSDRLIKWMSLGGYFAYGTKDKAWKYGGDAKFKLNENKRVELKASYSEDVFQRAGYHFTPANLSFSSNTAMRNFFRTSMDSDRKAELQLSFSPRANIQVYARQSYEWIHFNQEYTYFANGDSLNAQADCRIAPTTLEINWNIREKVIQLGSQRFAQKSSYPKIGVLASKGWKGFQGSEFDYLRLTVSISQDINVFRLGKLSWSLVGQTVEGDVPLFLLHTPVSTRKDWNLSVVNSFETVYPTEFYATSMASFFVRHMFPSIRTKATWNEPQFGVHYAAGIGVLDRPENHSTTVKTLNKGLHEVGAIFSGIITSGTVGVGIGGFYRMGPLSDPNWKKNIVPKIAVSLGF